jgi:hypothetical protein
MIGGDMREFLGFSVNGAEKPPSRSHEFCCTAQ